LHIPRQQKKKNDIIHFVGKQIKLLNILGCMGLVCGGSLAILTTSCQIGSGGNGGGGNNNNE
jgi:hypothetical protein